MTTLVMIILPMIPPTATPGIKDKRRGVVVALAILLLLAIMTLSSRQALTVHRLRVCCLRGKKR